MVVVLLYGKLLLLLLLLLNIALAALALLVKVLLLPPLYITLPALDEVAVCVCSPVAAAAEVVVNALFAPSPPAVSLVPPDLFLSRGSNNGDDC